jgi:hypothetical protein
MKATFVESTGFSASVTELISDLFYLRVQLSLMRNPDLGVVMPGCGGLRKIRVADPKRQKGKRGGARIIYLHIPAAERFYMLDAYSKDEKDDLSASEKKQLRRLADLLRKEATRQKDYRSRSRTNGNRTSKAHL